MGSRPPIVSGVRGQENAASRLLIKQGLVSERPVQPVRRGALGEVGNKINAGCLNAVVAGKAQAAKPAVVTKARNLKSCKENAGAKTVRQESVVLSKKILEEAKNKAEAAALITAPEVRKSSLKYPDPDQNSRDDPQMVTEYVEDILEYLRQLEVKFPLKEKLLDSTKITSKMRSTLVNWLVDVHQNFNLELDTLHLCVSLVDRYLQVNKTITKSIYQLVGTASLLLACKYEEIYVPELDDFVYICDNAFTKKQLLQMEIDIVQKLDFRMGWPLSVYFLRRYSKLAVVKPEQHTLAKYILELSLLEYDMVQVKPSLQAAAACCLSIAVMNEVSEPSKVWKPALAYHTKYKYSDLKNVIYQLAQILTKAENAAFQKIPEKYAQPKYSKISLNYKLNGPLLRKLTASPGLNTVVRK
ncbi:G2/mitotic-specific cyclin-B [Dendroctonus ponderosae]|uniref:Uncharacterized protein n=1 Tax=Dendroctonus ponderosae TaxID=77166 RepID=U4UJQ4_DENPD|nr:G2/mitotic-specific cyclin-B [Dendroctonus ponderosae]XP_048523336.1 G2/mitotic-specific cyclin-B [Dendroctonus ponderosae]ERL90401.1 hypothetical protein D910_07750 [Dendroctonus ponderosae]KAH1015265.1 hypothetical protein HUJ05_013025 [Dendroctonus ponderosae]